MRCVNLQGTYIRQILHRLGRGLYESVWNSYSPRPSFTICSLNHHKRFAISPYPYPDGTRQLQAH